MDEYIEQWLKIIENMNNDNTYKLAWGRSIIENVCNIKEIEDYNKISFEDIAHVMIKYYWNQTFFFDLKQSPNQKKPPVLVTNVYKLIDEYKRIEESNIPVWFDKAETKLKEEPKVLDKVIKQSAKKLKDDVSWRFMNVYKEKCEVYDLNKEDMYIVLTRYQVLSLQQYSMILTELLNYKWAQLLEKFNNTPRIASKVKGISDNTLKRNSLSQYKKVLLEYYGKPVDFYTDESLDENDISIDHVIPWSFMYSDDIWNLVMTSKSNNSSKSNSIPTEEIIEKLKKRNELIASKIADGKYKNDLVNSIENDYVDKFYLAIRL